MLFSLLFALLLGLSACGEEPTPVTTDKDDDVAFCSAEESDEPCDDEGNPLTEETPTETEEDETPSGGETIDEEAIETTPEEELTEMANPASVYCEEQGGTSEIRTEADGAQVGYCVFEDGSSCEEWEYMEGNCMPGFNPEEEMKGYDPAEEVMTFSCTAAPQGTFDQTSCPEEGETVFTIHTNMGDITLRLFDTKTPKTVENFVTHAKDGYYDGIIFHRVIDGFMIQGGDPQGTGMGGESIWGGNFEDEFDPELSNIPGSISMANAGPNTNGSQFFINQVNNNFLDNRHTVFGQVLEGMDVVETIAKTTTGANDKPLEDVVIQGVEIVVEGSF